MKSKGGSLYEVLKSASRAPGEAASAPAAPDTTPVGDGNQGTLQERLAAYKAAKLAAANEPTVQVKPEPAPPPKVSATTLVLEPDPTPIPSAAPARVVERPTFAVTPPAPARVEADPAPVDPGPGSRMVTLTLNTVLFSGMVVVGLLFMAYAIGLHVGKGSVPAAAPVVEAPPRPAVPPPIRVITPPPPPPPIVRKEYTIRLADLKYVTAQDRLKAQEIADDPNLKKALERAGHKGYETAKYNRNGELRMNLYVDRFSDINSEAAKAALTAMKNFRWKNSTPFQGAAFEEAQPR